MSRNLKLLVSSFAIALITIAATLHIMQKVPVKAAVGSGSMAAIPKANSPAEKSVSAAMPANVAVPKQGKTAPEGGTVYTTVKGESVPGIIRRYLPNTTYMTGRELEAAIRETNPELKGIFPKPGTEIIIPNYAPMPWTEKPVAVPNDFEVRAVYLTGAMAGSEKGQGIIRNWRARGGNAVVFDIKDSDGSISVPFDNPLAPQQNSYPLRNLAKFTRFVHSQGMHSIARIAIFRDEAIVAKHPQVTIRSRRTGEPWRENGKLVWTDPSRKDVQDYNIALAKYAAANGADEVQFDYVRFPAEGDQKDARFAYEAEHPDWQRSDVIVSFLENAHKQLKPMGVLFSLDVFGVMAWQRSVDLSHTGQDIPRMARNCDVLSPMIYPSHFFGMDGYTMPGDAPEHFITESMKKFQKITEGSGVVLRPWLQAFGWKTKTYSPEYIEIQVKASKENGGVGFLFWNARNDYEKPLTAMPSMKPKLFRGDEVKDFAGKVSLTASVTTPEQATSK